MNTYGKTNVEFRNEVYEILAWHKSRLDQVNALLQMMLIELQALHISR